MSSKENLHRLIDQLSDEKAEALERVAIQLLRDADPTWGQPKPGMSFEEAIEYTNRNFGSTLKKLAQ